MNKMKGLVFKKIKRFFFLLFQNSKKFKYVIILIFIVLIEVINFSSSQRNVETKSHYIFTFWEPSNSIPGYIILCINTWKQYLPKDYRIVILDYHNLKDYLNDKLINKILVKQMTLPIQADAIRVAVLQKYGGFWMDCDTIITNSSFMNMFYGSDLIMFGNSKRKILNIGFIYASNNSTLLKIWLDGIIKRSRIYKQRLLLKHIFPSQLFNKYFDRLLTWNYLGNGIINEIVKNASSKSFKLIERDEAYSLPDMSYKKEPIQNYRDFYFTEGDPEPILKKCKGVLLLHNSWTIYNYKKMSQKEFLQQDIMLARLLSRLLRNVSIISDIN